MVDPAPVAAEVASVSSLRGCNGCELALGRKLGVDFVAIGWVQKVSNLILNLNLQVRDVASGAIVAAGTVDIRGNTDEVLAARACSTCSSIGSCHRPERYADCRRRAISTGP